MPLQCGRFETTPISTAPASAEKLLTENNTITKAVVAELFSDLDPSSINLAGKTADSSAIEALGEFMGKNMTLNAISFAGGSISPIAALAASLPENLSIQRVDVSNCNLNGTDALVICEKILPWNRTVTDWNFSGNVGLGDEGVLGIVEQFVKATLSVQRLSFKGCGINDEGAMKKIIHHLGELTSLYQVDLNDNAGFSSSLLPLTSELDATLQRNLKLLKPNDEVKLVPLIGEPAATVPASTAEPKPSAPVSGANSPVTQSRTSSMRPRQQSTVNRAPPPVAAKKTVSRTQSKERLSPTPSSGSKTDGQKKPEAPATKSKPQASPKRVVRPSTSPSPAPVRSARAESPKPWRDPPPATNSPRRSVTPTRHKIDQKQVSEEEHMKKWKEIKEQYNQFIRAGSPAASNNSPARKEPPALKYVLGKKVDSIKQEPSAAFRSTGGLARERDPTPLEIRKYAPWNQKTPDGQPASFTGVKTRVKVQGETMVTFIDGGKQTYIEDDPRDVGFQARKIQKGEVPNGTLYKSGTVRECRWGTSFKDRSWVHKEAQAPDPGAYTVESEFERNARKAKENERKVSATGRPCFGTCGSAPRISKLEKDLHRPGPGEYEIP